MRPQQHDDPGGRLAALVRSFSGRRVTVVGDLVADQFITGEISRVSREAPVLILRHEQTETVPGGAANCAVNLAAMGARVALAGAVGEDESGRALIERLEGAGVETSGVVRSPSLRTTTKVRILAGLPHSTRQQVVRVDYESGPLADASVRARINDAVRAAAPGADAFIVSDYNYGVADESVARFLREAAAERGVPVLVDSRFRLMQFGGFTSATPNEDEVEQVLGVRVRDAAALERAGAELRERLGYRALLITRGRQGMMLIEDGAPPLHLASVGARDAVDVTGAGDTVIAAYALALASGGGATDAARIANHAGGLVVMKRGTASVTGREILASIEHQGDA